METEKSIPPKESIAQAIIIIRGRRVILDHDLAIIYGVKTKALNQAVKRNEERFPEDFMFQLTDAEKSKVVTDCDHLHRLKYSTSLPYAFTEHGAIMAANVLNSEQAIIASVFVVRAFIQLREMLAAHKELSLRIAELERRIDQNDETVIALVAAIRELMMPAPSPRKPIGFMPRGKYQ